MPSKNGKKRKNSAPNCERMESTLRRKLLAFRSPTVKSTLYLGTLLFFACLLALPAWGQEKGQDKPKERDIFNYLAQEREPKEVRKIVFIADTRPHGAKGNHEFCAG